MQGAAYPEIGWDGSRQTEIDRHIYIAWYRTLSGADGMSVVGSGQYTLLLLYSIKPILAKSWADGSPICRLR